MTDPASGTDLAPLDELVDDAKRLPLAMLPRPRQPRRTVDLAPREVVIPDTAADFLAEYADYGV